MKSSDIEVLVREHFRREVLEATAALESRTAPDPPAGPSRAGDRGSFSRPAHPWALRVATAAVLVALPLLMWLGAPTLDPLAAIIDQRWSEGGRARVEEVLLAIDGLIDLPNGSQEESK